MGTELAILINEEKPRERGYPPNLVIYKPPELLRRSGKFDCSAIDIYSYGFILWEVLSRKRASQVPFYERLDDIVDKNARPPVEIDCPESYLSLMERCWHPQINARPNFEEAAQTLLGIIWQVGVE